MSLLCPPFWVKEAQTFQKKLSAQKSHLYRWTRQHNNKTCRRRYLTRGRLTFALQADRLSRERLSQHSRFLRGLMEKRPSNHNPGHQAAKVGRPAHKNKATKRNNSDRRVFYRTILTTSAVSSTNIGSILIFASCAIVHTPVARC